MTKELKRNAQKFSSKLQAPKRILLIRNDALGDLITSFPLVGILKAMWPKTEILFLLNPPYKTLALNLQGVDGVFEWSASYNKKDKLERQKRFKNRLELIEKLKSKKIDLALVLYPTYENAVIVKKSGIPNRLGSGRRWYSFLFNIRSYEHKKYSLFHESIYTIRLLMVLTKKKQNIYLIENRLSSIIMNSNTKQIMSFLPNLIIPNNTNEGLDLFFQKHSEKSYIVIHPLKTASSLKWELSSFMELINLILQDDDLTNFQVVLTGTESEKNQLEQIEKSVSIASRVHLFSDLNLSELSYLYSKASLWIGNSTGPMHLANYIGTAVIALFAKAPAFRAKRWGPIYHSNSLALEPDIPACKSCSGSTCEFFNCLSLISSNILLKNIKGALSLPIK